MKKLNKLIIIIIFSAAAAYSQSMDSIMVQNGKAAYRIRNEMLMSPVMVKLNNLTVKSGMLYHITNDSIYLFRDHKVESIAYTDIAILLLTNYSSSAAPVIYGAVAGLIAGGLISQIPEDAVPFYSSTFIENTIPIYEALFALLGASVGYFYESSASEENYMADFTNKDSFQKTKQKFIEMLTESKDEPKYRISLSSSYVYTTKRSGNGFYSYNERPPINMFRKISLTRLLPDNLEAGLLLVNLNEQPVHWYTGEGQLDETYSGYGLFAYGGYNYYPLKDSKDLNLNVGLGLGASSVNYSLKNTVWGYIEQDGNYSYGLVTSETTLKEQFFTLNLSAKVQFTLIDKLWMGIEYDNVIIPGKSKPRISNMQLEEEALGNSSLGITFGLNLR